MFNWSHAVFASLKPEEFSFYVPSASFPSARPLDEECLEQEVQSRHKERSFIFTASLVHIFQGN